MFKIFLTIFLASFLYATSTSYECENCEKLKNKKIQKVYASNPALLYALYSFDKDLIAGIVFEFWDIEKKFVDKRVYELPVVGGFYGLGKTPDTEMIIKLKPDLVISTLRTKEENSQQIKILRELKIPILYVNSDDAVKVKIYEIYGEIFNNKKRAEELIAYGNESEELAKKTKILSKPSVYYAFGKDGLQSECGSSIFIELIDKAGGDTEKFACKTKNLSRRVKVDFEKILSIDPDVILVYHKEFYDKIYSLKEWSLLKAVKNKRVYLIPRSPFSWVGKPASFMRFLGLRWLLKVLHEQDIDLRKEAKKFYKLFLYTNLSEEDLDFVLNEKK